MSKPLLPAYDKLSEALLGLCVLVTREPMTNDEMIRLVEQWRRNYPEVLVAGPALKEIAAIVTRWRAHDDPQAGEEMTAILALAEGALSPKESDHA